MSITLVLGLTVYSLHLQSSRVIWNIKCFSSHNEVKPANMSFSYLLLHVYLCERRQALFSRFCSVRSYAEQCPPQHINIVSGKDVLRCVPCVPSFRGLFWDGKSRSMSYMYISPPMPSLAFRSPRKRTAPDSIHFYYPVSYFGLAAAVAVASEEMKNLRYLESVVFGSGSPLIHFFFVKLFSNYLILRLLEC